MTMTIAPLPNLKQILAAREKEEGKRKAEAARLEAEKKAQQDLERITRIIPKEDMGSEDDEDEDIDDIDEIRDDSE